MARITVIEDSREVRTRLIKLLPATGVGELQWIGSPPFFDRKVEASVRKFKPDLIVLDLLLDRDIESGFRVLRQLKSSTFLKDIPVVVLSKFISASAEDENKRRAEALGAAKAVPKIPFPKLSLLLSLRG